MEYYVHILSVGDADAIVINYRDDNTRWWTIVIDAGNVGDGEEVKRYIKHIENGCFIIDYAVCTHPDKDHKGGFFDLYNDATVVISNFVFANPENILSCDWRRLNYQTGLLAQKGKETYNHPTDCSKNLIDIIRRSNSQIYQWSYNMDFVGVPLKIVGPEDHFLQDSIYEMALDFAEITDEADAELYNEDEILTDKEVKSVMDREKETSATNKASLILLFHPGNQKFLLAGDACAKSLHDVVYNLGDEVKNCILKVPHHGSKHNLTTDVIDLLAPTSATISCKGSKKHPNSGVVYWLSKYCDVYSTAKSGTLTYQSMPVKYPAEPLKRKQIIQ